MASPGPSNEHDSAVPLNGLSDAHGAELASFRFVSRGSNGDYLASDVYLVPNESIFSVLSQVRREHDQHEAHRGGLNCVCKLIRRSFCSKVPSVVKIDLVQPGATQGVTRNRIIEVSVAGDSGQRLEDLEKYLRDLSNVPRWPSFQSKYPVIVSHGSTRTDNALFVTYSRRKGPIAVCLGVILMVWLIIGAVIMVVNSTTIGIMVAGVGATVMSVLITLALWGFH